MMTVWPSVDLYDVRLRTMAKALGPAIVRYYGSWVTKTYFDADGKNGKTPPAGFDAVLTAEQWQGALDFAEYVGAEILVSVANCPGVHRDGTESGFRSRRLCGTIPRSIICVYPMPSL